MQRFVVCGEALIDLAPVAGVDGCGAPEGSTFRSAWEALSAGGPMNTAVGLARLGERVEFCGRLSTDRFGQQLTSHLRANGVGLELAVTSDDPTSLAVVSLDAHQKASYAFHFDRTANFAWAPDELPDLTDDDWLHLGSLALVVQPGADVLLEWVRATRARVSLDLNVRPSVIADPQAYWRAVRPWLEAVGRHEGVVKASDDDIVFLARGAGVTGDPIDVLGRWGEEFGASVSVVTLGADGAVAAQGGAVTVRPGRAVEVVDTVGAGDTFMAGFLGAHAAEAPLADALDRGIAASALVCTRQGPQPPTQGQLEAFVQSLSRP